MIRQTVFGFKLEKTEEALTAHGGLALMAEFNHGLGLKGLVDRYLPWPGSNRGYAPSVFVDSLAYNTEFMETAAEPGTCFVPLVIGRIEEILCEQYERTIGRDNCVIFEGLTLQIPADQYRCNYVQVNVRVHRYPDASLALFHGPRKLATYHPNGLIQNLKKETTRSSPRTFKKADNSFATKPDSSIC